MVKRLERLLRIIKTTFSLTSTLGPSLDRMYEDCVLVILCWVMHEEKENEDDVDLNWLLFFLVLRSLHVVLNIPWLQQFFHFLTHNQTQMAQHTPFIYKEDKDRKSFNHGGLSSIIIQWSHYIARPPLELPVFMFLILW